MPTGHWFQRKDCWKETGNDICVVCKHSRIYINSFNVTCREVNSSVRSARTVISAVGVLRDQIVELEKVASEKCLSLGNFIVAVEHSASPAFTIQYRKFYDDARLARTAVQEANRELEILKKYE